MIRPAYVAFVVAALFVGCSDKKPVVQPVAGDLTVAYDGPAQTDGALLVVVNGAVSDVRAVGGYQVASAPAGATATRVVITGALVPGDVFVIRVPDVGSATTYSAVIEAAADRNTFALGDPTSYRATVRK